MSARDLFEGVASLILILAKIVLCLLLVATGRLVELLGLGIGGHSGGREKTAALPVLDRP